MGLRMKGIRGCLRGYFVEQHERPCGVGPLERAVRPTNASVWTIGHPNHNIFVYLKPIGIDTFLDRNISIGSGLITHPEKNEKHTYHPFFIASLFHFAPFSQNTLSLVSSMLHPQNKYGKKTLNKINNFNKILNFERII